MDSFVAAFPVALPVGQTVALDQLLCRQSGAVGIRQLRGLGVTADCAVAQVEAERWQHPVRGVYVTFNGPLPRSTLRAVALVYGGARAVLSHRTAAEEWGMVPPADSPIHITVPYGTSAISQGDLIVVHRSRAFRHIVVATDPPRTSRADTAIDLAVEEPEARAAHRALVGLLTGGGVKLHEVERQLERRPPRRYRRVLAHAVNLVRHGVQSVLEELYAVDVEQAHGIPAARRQTPLSVDGATLYEDATYDHIGVPLTVRLDGRTHLRAGTAFRDRRRDNAAELAGRSRLVFGWRDLSRDPCAGARDVIAVLRRWGWAGDTSTCSRCQGS